MKQKLLKSSDICESFLDNEVLLLVVIHTNWTKRRILNFEITFTQEQINKVIEAVSSAAARPSDWNEINLEQVSATTTTF